MASRCRSLTKPALSLFKSTVCKPTLKPAPSPSLLTPRSSLTSARSFAQLGSLQSMLPLHAAVSSARLTSCLGIDSRSSRSMCQGDTVGLLKQSPSPGLNFIVLYQMDEPEILSFRVTKFRA